MSLSNRSPNGEKNMTDVCKMMLSFFRFQSRHRVADNIRSGISYPDVFRVDKLGDIVVEQAVGHLDGQICFCCDCQMGLNEEREEMNMN